MSTHNSQNAFFRLFRTRWFYIVNFVLIILVGVSFGREVVHSRDISIRIATLKKQQQELQAEHLAITDLKDAVQTETFVEGEARLKLGLKKPGENLVILKDQKTATKSPSRTPADGGKTDTDTPDVISEKQLANSTKWWYYFFNKQAYRDAQSL